MHTPDVFPWYDDYLIGNQHPGAAAIAARAVCLTEDLQATAQEVDMAREAEKTCGNHITGFLDYIRIEQNLSPNTVASYRYDVAKWDRWLPAERSFESVTRADLRAFMAELHTRHTIASVRRIMAALKQFYGFLRAEGYIAASPVDNMPKLKLPAVLPRYLPWEEVERLIAAPLKFCRRPGHGHNARPSSVPCAHRNHALLELLAATGCRISEAVDLQLGDIVPGAVRVFGKGRKERTIPLHARAERVLSDYLTRWRPLLRPRSDCVFINRWGGPLNRRTCQVDIQRYAVAAGITQRVHPHLLRHSFATELVRQGAPLPVVRDLLGHSSVSSTNIYSHVAPEHLRAAYLQYHPAG